MAAPETVEDALLRASTHARDALGEATEAGRALLDVLSLVTTDRPARDNQQLATLARILDDLAARISTRGPSTDPTNAFPLRAFTDALDQEITRWEGRAVHDADARAVLRAFLGMREVLWELGVRQPRESPPRKDEANEDTGPGTQTEPLRTARA